MQGLRPQGRLPRWGRSAASDRVTPIRVVVSDSVRGPMARSGAPRSSSIHVTKAPEGLLYIALAAAVVSIALSALFESVVVAGIGWVLAVLVGLGAATVFVVRNAKRQTSPWYLYSSRPQLLYRLSVLLCFLAIVATSVRIALFVGRM